MPQPWLEGIKRRSVEFDFRYYDPPGRIWEILNRQTWEYKKNPVIHKVRDLALMSVLYWSSSRISEIVRASIYQTTNGELQHIGDLPSVKTSQFVKVEKDFLNLRDLRIMKRQVQQVDDYPKRNEIRFPLSGDLSTFTEPLLEYLEYLGPNDELFHFKNKRGYPIVSHCTKLPNADQGLMPHFLREMGLKFRLRLYDKNVKQLQDFSGHSSIENLLRYLAEVEDVQAILGNKFHKETPEAHTR